MQNDHLFALLETALEASRTASGIVQKYYRQARAKQLRIETKADHSPVTIADREAESAIREVLSRDWPRHDIYGEEHGRLHAASDYLWLVDPIDGTKSFVRGYGFFSVQIALLHQEEIILGVSCAPVMDELAWAARGQGAYLNDQPLTVSNIDALDASTLSTGNLASLAVSTSWPALGELLAGADKTRGYGDYYHYHRLAAGQLEAVIESDLNILDIAALSVIIEEAGGRVTDLQGQRLNLETRSLLASNSRLHDTILEKLAYTDPDSCRSCQ